MSGRKLKRWLGLGLVLAMPGMPAEARGVLNAPIVVMISVHDDAGIPWGTIRASENEASRVFRAAGIEIDWRNCDPSNTSGEEEKWKNCVETAFPEHLHVRIVKRSIGLSPEVMGISFLSEDGRGFQADVFYDGIKALQTESNASLVIVLGHVVAHEIGHLLLGPNSHTPRGIMRAAWGHDELESASLARLLFSVQESQQMRERLASRIGAPCVGMERGAACTTPLN